MNDAKKPRLFNTAVYAAVADVVLVLVFAVSGRSSHEESLAVAGVLRTAWPFLAALALGWLATRNWRAPVRLWPNGVLIWVITVMAGMILRVATGNTAAVPFILVAAVVLGVFLLGHRAVAGLLRRRATHNSARGHVG
ncbi:DUF3054 domain-containing protein [Pseudarthrobacter sp. P1]|uniref:DUF3054 domain-containing protein n=1 Tax=Pseudarthrobacter sp. P1 TaxID=3418418 RepID=UPI003CF4A6D7